MVLTVSLALIAFSSLALNLWVFRKWLRVKPHLSRLSSVNATMKGSIEQFLNVSQELSKASEEQLRHIDSTVQGSHEITAMTKQTSDNAGHLNSQSQELKSLSVQGTGRMRELLDSGKKAHEEVSRFRSELQASLQGLAQVTEAIRSIEAKTQVINEIVFQTKLLSFNASVEAARAGEHGKGFAVVAQEVGALAEMSGKASSEIRAIVDDSVQKAQAAVDETRTSLERILDATETRSQDTLRASEAANELFRNLGERVQTIVQSIQQISNAAAEQGQGVRMLDESLNSLQQVASQNSLVASQTIEHTQAFDQSAGEFAACVHELHRDLGLELRVQLQRFEWNEGLTLHVKEMDHEHHILVDRINALVDALGVAAHGPAVEEAFQAMASYTKEHFAHEEKYLEGIQYPQLKPHQKIHRNLLAQVETFGADIRHQRLDREKLVAFLRNWLMSHIMGVDKQYARYSGRQRSSGARAA